MSPGLVWAAAGPEHRGDSARFLLGGRRGEVRRVYLSDREAAEFAAVQPDGDTRIDEDLEVRVVGDLEALLKELWPAIFTGSSA